MMQLPFGFGQLDWGDWVRGLASAFITGGASAVVTGFTVALSDPKDYSLGSDKFLHLVLNVFVASGLLGGMAFLRTKPIPDVKTVTTTVEKTVQQSVDPQITMKKTVQEVHQEPIDPKKG